MIKMTSLVYMLFTGREVRIGRYLPVLSKFERLKISIFCEIEIIFNLKDWF